MFDNNNFEKKSMSLSYANVVFANDLIESLRSFVS